MIHPQKSGATNRDSRSIAPFCLVAQGSSRRRGTAPDILCLELGLCVPIPEVFFHGKEHVEGLLFLQALLQYIESPPHPEADDLHGNVIFSAVPLPHCKLEMLAILADLARRSDREQPVGLKHRTVVSGPEGFELFEHGQEPAIYFVQGEKRIHLYGGLEHFRGNYLSYRFVESCLQRGQIGNFQR